MTYLGESHYYAYSSNTVTISSPPTGIQQNDFMVALVARDGNASNPTATPSNWVKIGGTHDVGALDYVTLWIKPAGASEAGPYVWTFSVAAKCEAVICAWRDIYNLLYTTIDVSDVVYSTSDTIARAASYSVTRAKSTLINSAAFYYSASSGSFAPPSSPVAFTEDYDSGHVDDDLWLTMASAIWNSSGATGDMDFTMNVSNANKHAFSIAVPPMPYISSITGGTIINMDDTGIQINGFGWGFTGVEVWIANDTAWATATKKIQQVVVSQTENTITYNNVIGDIPEGDCWLFVKTSAGQYSLVGFGISRYYRPVIFSVEPYIISDSKIGVLINGAHFGSGMPVLTLRQNIDGTGFSVAQTITNITADQITFTVSKVLFSSYQQAYAFIYTNEGRINSIGGAFVFDGAKDVYSNAISVNLSTAHGQLKQLARLSSVDVLDVYKIRLHFNNRMTLNGALSNTINYNIIPVTPGAVKPYIESVVIPDVYEPSYIDLIVTEMTNAKTYNVVVSPYGPVDINGLRIDENYNELPFTSIGIIPTIKHITSISSTRIDVKFSEKMKYNSAIIDSNQYKADNGLEILSVLSFTEDTVCLATSEQNPNTLYTLTIGVAP